MLNMALEGGGEKKKKRSRGRFHSWVRVVLSLVRQVLSMLGSRLTWPSLSFCVVIHSVTRSWPRWPFI